MAVVYKDPRDDLFSCVDSFLPMGFRVVIANVCVSQ